MAIGFTELLIIVVVLLLLFAVIPFWIWALMDCLKNEPSEGNDKLIWTLVILLGGAPGAMLYLAMRRSQRVRAASR